MTEEREDSSATVYDPSAERLHDICGYLLLYYRQHRALPPSLEALRAARSGEIPPLLCPESGQPYLYQESAVEMPGRPGRLLVHAPSRARATVQGYPSRWAVLVAEPRGEGPLVAQVVLIPEAEIRAALAARARGEKPEETTSGGKP